MCNIYKNNLNLLSQIEENQSLYYDDENRLHIDDRILGYFRRGTKESKIAFIIKNSYLQLFNCYIINLVSKENHLVKAPAHDLYEIKNSKHILRSSLLGLQTYLNTLINNNNNYLEIKKINEELNNTLDKIDEIKMEYILKIDSQEPEPNKSKSWLYQLYESTLKSKSPIDNQSDDDSDLDFNEESDTETDEAPDEELESSDEEVESPQLGDYFPEDFGEDTEPGFVRNFMFHISKHLVYIFLGISRQFMYFFN